MDGSCRTFCAGRLCNLVLAPVDTRIIVEVSIAF